MHIAPTFGADDAKVAKEANVPPMMVIDSSGELVPLVNLKGAFIDGLGSLSGKYVKNEFQKIKPIRKAFDVEIAIHLKKTKLLK